MRKEVLKNWEKLYRAISGNKSLVGISEIIRELQPREQTILDYRFGLTDGLCHTLEDTGKKFYVTRERIRQLEARAIIRLRKHNPAYQLWKI